MISKLVSGGQTGADRAALDFAIEHNITHGGWCPKGRRAEDGPIDPHYNLTETPTANYLQRTEWNVRDSDATAIFTLSPELSGGSKKTAEFAKKHKKPCLHLRPQLETPSWSLAQFLEHHKAKVLNVAGTRGSKEPEVGAFVKKVLEEVFSPMNTLKETLLHIITDYFVTSNDFNGMSLHQMKEMYGLDPKISTIVLEELILEGKLSLVFEDNPYVKRFPDVSVKEQLKALRDDSVLACVYPSPAELQKVVDPSQYSGRPFSLRLAIGEPHLTPVFFELPVLERYFTDPRYHVTFADYVGSICVSSDAYSQTAARDKVFLKTFGIGFNPSGSRVVVVYLRYLHNLTPEHQQYWSTHLESTHCVMLRDYFDATILAKWRFHISVYKAFLKEQVVLNDMAKLMGKPPLFRETYDGDKRPRHFCVLLLPTAKRLDEFIHLLDKMLSENLNKEFFQGDVPLEEDIPLSDGRIQVRSRGTISLLQDWLVKKITVPAAEEFDPIIGPFRQIRQLRQKPAHSVTDDTYNRQFEHEQNELMESVYNALRLLRLLFSKHPKVQGYEVPKLLKEGRIKSY